MDAGIASRGEVVQNDGIQNAAGAEAHKIDVFAARDLSYLVNGRQDPLRVRVDRPVRLLLCGVAPAEHECLYAAADGVLHEAPPGRQTQEVEPADRRRG